MLTAPGLGLRPERIVVMALAVALAWALAAIPLPWEPDSQSLRAVWFSTFPATPDGPHWWQTVALQEGRLIVLASDHTLSFLLPGVPIAAVLLLACAAVSRMAAIEFGLSAFLTVPQALRFTLQRAPSLAGAFLLPAGLALGAWVLIAAGGAVLLRLPGVDVVGAVVYTLAILLGLAVSLLLVTLSVAWPLIIPAVVCESVGSGEYGHGDAVDALQRSVAYTLNAPVRAGLYGGIGLLQTTAIAWVVGLVAAVAAGFTRSAATHWLPDQRAAELPASTAGQVMHLAETIPWVLGAAVVLCTATAAFTVAYLLLRRVCDGQDEREIWIPSAGLAPTVPPPATDDADDE
jgi:hypothetical protein